ncbi:MAG: hypothetical protein M1517_02795 [Deltaproteobacteria bacterium]|nr:hypothetical protein [Deltaproteobacteria bacterium]
MGLIEQKERVFDTAKGNTSGLPAMLPWYSAWTASLSLWKYGDVMGRNPLYRKELCFTSRGENSFFMITNGRGTKIYHITPRFPVLFYHTQSVMVTSIV